MSPCQPFPGRIRPPVPPPREAAGTMRGRDQGRFRREFFSFLLTAWPRLQGSVAFLLYSPGFLDRFVLRKVLEECPVPAGPWLCVPAGFFTL